MRNGGRKGTKDGFRHPLFVIFFAVLAASIPAFLAIYPSRLALSLGFDLAAATFLVTAITWLGGAKPDALRAAAARNDGGRGTLLAISALLLAAILVVVGLEIGAPQSVFQIIVVVATLFLAWAFGNMVFAVHYAHMFYDRAASRRDRGGLSIPGTTTPDFSDFAYFAFVLGMTFQVSDIVITRNAIRRVALFHGIVAFLFNIGIVALTVNMIGSYLGR